MLRLIVVYIGLLTTFSAGPSYAQIQKGEVKNDRSWTVQDNVKIDRLPSFLERDFSSSPFHLSPDRSHVAFNVLSSDLATNETLSTLHVYETNSLLEFAGGGPLPEPAFVKTRVGQGIIPGLRSFKWLSDSTSLFFLSLEKEGSQLRRWSVGDDVDTAVEGVATELNSYQLIGADYVASFHLVPPNRYQADNAPFIATGLTLQGILLPSEVPKAARPAKVTLTSLRDISPPFEVEGLMLRSSVFLGAERRRISVSPDGRKIAFVQLVDAAKGDLCWRAKTSSRPTPSQDRPLRSAGEIVFLDLETFELSRPFGGPLGTLSGVYGVVKIVWTEDSSTAIVPFTYTANDQCSHKNEVRSGPGAYSYSFDTGSLEQIRDYSSRLDGSPRTRPIALDWDRANQAISIDEGLWSKSSTPETIGTVQFRRVGGQWKQFALGNNIRQTSEIHFNVLELRQDYNTPPAIHAVGRDGESRLLIDLAPHAHGREFGTVKQITWLDYQENEWTGLLALPPGFDEERRVPLILQTHGFSADSFFAEGPTTTMFPGRAALDRGFAVLTVKLNTRVVYASRAEEGRRIVDGYRSAIQSLSDAGIIDSERVGAIGWSRTSYHVKYALVHAPDLFAAAVVGDGIDFGYWQYIFVTDYPRLNRYTEAYNGNPWTNMDRWSERAPGFNMESVLAPVRIEANTKYSAVIGEWEFYAGLRRLNNPVDLIVYPDGEHSLVAPQERIVSTQGSIDWLDFWINGTEDADPSKADQYWRWRGMREERCIWGDQSKKPAYCDHIGAN